ncbi:helicase associated domain-containing protein [Streptomyces virginiae]|uniref:helicase associated domain-containing protein n=1 Tax=Streptomyces virginiae TaxID=1961 RepID=UPI003870540E
MEDGTKLGVWAGQMRAKYTRGVLPAERVERLTAAGLSGGSRARPSRGSWRRPRPTTPLTAT